nr:hypothetical protein [Tanacetum cinerariifolium]
MGYENPNTTPETESDEIIKSGVEELVQILSENEVTSEDKTKCDVPVCENFPICDDHSEIFFDSKNDDDISSDDDDFEDIEYVEASLPDPEIVIIEEENVVHQEEEEVDLEDIFQIQDIILREKLLNINRLIANIESLIDNPTPDHVLNSSVSFPISEESDNSLLDKFSLEFETFSDQIKETRSGNTTTHADDSLLEYDSFCFEIEPDQERLINVVKNDIPDDSSNDPFLEEADLFLSDNSIPPVVMNGNDELECLDPRDEFDDYSFIFVIRIFLPYLIYSKMFLSFLSAESEDTIFDPEPKYSSSMGYEHPNTTPKTESDEIIKSGVEELVPIPSECEVTLEDKRECDMLVCENSPICDDHSENFSDSNNDDDISSDDDDFEDIEYVEESLPDPEIVSVEEENDVYHEEEDVDLEDISQIQDIVLHEKLLSINRLIANIESLNNNPTPDRVLNSSALIPIFEESDNSLSDNFSPEFKTFCDHTEETRSGNTTTHANDSLPEYDSFCFKIEPDQERLINVVKNDISKDSSNDPLLEEADLFFASDNSIPPGIENFAYDSEGDIRFLKELLIDDSIPFPNNESPESNFDNPSIPRPPPEPPDAEIDFEIDAGEEIPVVINDNDELECIDPRDENNEDDDYFLFMFVI